MWTSGSAFICNKFHPSQGPCPFRLVVQANYSTCKNRPLRQVIRPNHHNQAYLSQAQGHMAAHEPPLERSSSNLAVQQGNNRVNQSFQTPVCVVKTFFQRSYTLQTPPHTIGPLQAPATYFTRLVHDTHLTGLPYESVTTCQY